MNLWPDLRYAARTLLARKSITGLAMISLALGIAANSTVFSLVDAMFLRPLAVTDPERIVELVRDPASGRGEVISFADYLDLRRDISALEGLAAISRRGTVLHLGELEESLSVAVVSDNFFEVTGVGADRGRLFDRVEDARLAEPPVILSHGLWQRRFQGDPAAIGKVIRLMNDQFTVVGVLPREFRGFDRGMSLEIWMPRISWSRMGGTADFESRRARHFEAIGRMRPGAGIGEVRAQADTVAARLAAAYPDTNRNTRYLVRPLETPAGGRTLLILAPIAIVLLIACANVATLLLAQGEARSRELAIRQAVGAGRWRLVRQALIEGSLLAAGAAALGLLLTAWLIELSPVLMPPGPSWVGFDVLLDRRVVAFTMAITVVATMIFAIAPALRFSRLEITNVLRSSGGESARLAGSRLLVISEIALSVVLLTGAGLLWRSLEHSSRKPTGLPKDKNVLITLGYFPREDLTRVQLLEIAAAKVQSLPGVKAVSYARRIPMAGYGGGASREVMLPGWTEAVPVKFNQVSPGYFSMMNLTLERGRGFTAQDDENSPAVAIATRAFARRFFGDADPVGRVIHIRDKGYQIVGLSSDAPVNQLHEQAQPFLYFPFAQAPSEDFTLLVETEGEPLGTLAAIRRALREIDPKASLSSETSLREHIRDSLYWDWMPARIAGALAALGVLLAFAGLFGVVSHSVTRRRREFGIRMAVGADSAAIHREVLLRSLRTTAWGVVLGLACAAAAGRLLHSFLHGTSPWDPPVFAFSALAATILSLFASQIPAIRASRVDPMTVLRAD
ncbi:MAG: ADOP family duplicated permease [Bryobacteraceae bacterium]|nr:ADOP family duplicated permease [Bryobacteraceae bacterium]